MDTKVLLLSVIVALVGIAFYVRTRSHQPRATEQSPPKPAVSAPRTAHGR